MEYSKRFIDSAIKASTVGINDNDVVEISGSDIKTLIERNSLLRERVQLDVANVSPCNDHLNGYDGYDENTKMYVEAKGQSRTKNTNTLHGAAVFSADTILPKLNEFRDNPVFFDVALWDGFNLVAILRMDSNEPKIIERLNEQATTVREKRKDANYRNSRVDFNVSTYFDAKSLEVLYFDINYKNEVYKEKKSIFSGNMKLALRRFI